MSDRDASSSSPSPLSSSRRASSSVLVHPPASSKHANDFGGSTITTRKKPQGKERKRDGRSEFKSRARGRVLPRSRLTFHIISQHLILPLRLLQTRREQQRIPHSLRTPRRTSSPNSLPSVPSSELGSFKVHRSQQHHVRLTFPACCAIRRDASYQRGKSSEVVRLGVRWG